MNVNHYIGFDVHKKSVSYCVKSAAGQEPGWTIEAEPKGRAAVAVARITRDHSIVQELVDRGFYSQEEAARSTNKNYVTRALGVETTVEVDVREHRAEKGDHYVLCSDGLTDMVEDEDIQLTISTFGDNLDTVAKQLVQLSNEHGGRDNISVVLAQVVDSFPARRGILDRILRWFG